MTYQIVKTVFLLTCLCLLAMNEAQGKCTGGDYCCSGDCKENEGDCDTDIDCAKGFKCGSSNCVGETFGRYDDCCYKEGTKGNMAGCNGADGCCTGQCVENQGDCDYHSDCAEGYL